MKLLAPAPLTPERFQPYGEVIDVARTPAVGMNDARFERFDDLCNVDIADGRVAVSIARSRSATRLPYRIDLVERHPLGSQAFIPLSPCRMYIVVAPPGEAVDPDDLFAFETNGTQGINYRLGTWHMPLISVQADQRFLIIDRHGQGPNCDVHNLDEPVMLGPSSAP